MKILQIHNQYKEWGGEDAVVDNERSLLMAVGHEVASPPVRNSTTGALLSTRQAWYRSLEAQLTHESFDVAHIHNLYSCVGNAVYPLLKKYNIPIVQTLHNYRLLCANGCLLDGDNKVCRLCTKGNFMHGVVKKCYRRNYLQSAFMSMQIWEGRAMALRYVDTFVAVSEFVRQEYAANGFPSDRIVVKPNYVYQPDYTSPVSDQGYALYLGRLSPEKGVHNLIRVFVDNGHNLKIVGDGPLRPELEAMAAGSPNIEFLGYIQGEQKETLFRECSFVVVPSEWYETFGMVVQEAYNYGKVVLAANIGALPYHVKDQTHLFDPGSFSGLRAAVDRQLYKLRLGQPMAHVCGTFQTPAQATQALVDVYVGCQHKQLTSSSVSV